MIRLGARTQVHACPRPVDMRLGFDGLYGLVRNELNADPLSGEMFLFVSRNRSRAKVLVWDGSGLCLFAKRLEKGRFAALWRAEGEPRLQLTASELALFLDGSRQVGKVELVPPPVMHGESRSADLTGHFAPG